MPNSDITIINNTSDTLYYDIDGYKLNAESVRNMAYEHVTNEMTDKTIDTIPGYTFNPHDTVHPGKLDTSWKTFATEKGGVTILFYKKDIERLPANQLLTVKNIYKRIDLTKHQLDSLKYRIVLN